MEFVSFLLLLGGTQKQKADRMIFNDQNSKGSSRSTHKFVWYEYMG